MPNDLVSRLDLDLLYLPFTIKLLDLVANCRARGHDYHAVLGFRTHAEQLALFAKGRDASGAVVEPKKVVTRLKYGAHNLGIAADLVLDADLNKPGLQPNYRPADYEVLAEEAEKLGLEAGARWKGFPDYGHVQLPLAAHGTNLGTLRRMEQIHGIKAAWAELDRLGPW